MFYISQFYKNLWQFRVKGFLFIVLTLTLMSVVHYRKALHQILSGGEFKKFPQFSAMVMKGAPTPMSAIASRIKSLPGVARIEVNSDYKIDTDLSTEASSALQDIQSTLDQEFTMMKVFMELNLSVEGQKLVQDFLKRLVGEEYVTTTRIKNPASEYANAPLWYQYKEWWLISFVAAMWMTVFVFLVSDTDSNFNILNTFQRKKDIGLKSYSLGLLTMFLPIAIALILFSHSVDTISLAIMAGLYFSALSMVQLKKAMR